MLRATLSPGRAPEGRVEVGTEALEARAEDQNTARHCKLVGNLHVRHGRSWQWH